MSLTSTILVLSNTNNHQPLVIEFISTQFAITNNNSPQLVFFNQQAEKLKIADVRLAISQASYANYDQNTRFLIFINADQATVPAQNALLKLLEEPPPNTLCILTANSLNKFLPTIKSRCQIKHFATALDSANAQGKDADQLTTNNQIGANLIKQFSDNPSLISYSQIIDQLENYKDQTSAIAMLKFCLDYALKQNLSAKHQACVLKSLQNAIKDLESNFNIKLSLAEAFFAIKNGLS